MDANVNKALVARYIAMHNTGDVAIVDAIIASDFVDHAHPKPGPGSEPVKRMVRGFRAAFPDATAVAEQMIAEGDTVGVPFVVRGTHCGPASFGGVPPSA